MNRTAVILLCVGLLLGAALGAAGAIWYSQYVTEHDPRLVWDAGLRDSDVLYVLLCAFDDDHSIDYPSWNVTLMDSQDEDFFPPVGVSQEVSYPVLDVIKSIGENKNITFAAAYVDDNGNISEWSTVTSSFDFNVGSIQGFRVTK